MNEFDWEQAKKQHCPDVFAWLEANHNNPKVTEQEYFEMLRDAEHICKHKKRNRANAKWEYDNLKEKFGFFKP